MLDIGFYRKIFQIKMDFLNKNTKNKTALFEKMESYRSSTPVVYNIETTNTCNMKCKMCPRTTLMTRCIETMDNGLFTKIAEQINPFPKEEWNKWEDFAEKSYGISKNGMGENHFFLFIIPKVVVLHGFGEPILDNTISEKVRILVQRNIPTYFSCNPSNINLHKIENLFIEGLDYIKFSLDSTADERQKNIRGKNADFTSSYQKILQLLEIKEKKNYKTTIVVSSIDLGELWSKADFNEMKSKFSGMDVYIYQKARDEQWYSNSRQKLTSIHWNEFCQFPWSSMTILSNGDVVPCTQDFNAEMVLGNIKNNSLEEIWNGEKYHQLRLDHLNCKEIKCNKMCDMKTMGNYDS